MEKRKEELGCRIVMLPNIMITRQNLYNGMVCGLSDGRLSKNTWTLKEIVTCSTNYAEN